MKNIYEYDLDKTVSFLKYGENKGNYHKNYSNTYCFETSGSISDLIEVLKYLRNEKNGILKKSILLDKPECSLAVDEEFISWKKLRIEKIANGENIGLFPFESNNSIALKLNDQNFLDFIECLLFTSKNNQEQSFFVGNNKIFVAP